MRSVPQMPAESIERVVLKGGLDLISQAPGSLVDCDNIELNITGGYETMKGTVRWKATGTFPPTPTQYQVLLTVADANQGNLSLWTTVTGSISGATGLAIPISSGYYEFHARHVVVVGVTGTFQASDVLSTGSGNVGTVSNIFDDSTDIPANLTIYQQVLYQRLAAVYGESLISAVPGSGPIRAVALIGEIVYAWRNSADGTELKVYKNVGSWSAISLGEELQFRAGSTAYTEGSTVSQGGVSATVSRVVLESGSWGAGTAAGKLIITGRTGGSFAAGALAGGGVATSIGREWLIRLAPMVTPGVGTPNSVRYVKAIFSGATSARVYGCDGVNPEFEFDGTAYVRLNTGQPRTLWADSFESDGDADGIADGWTAYSAGTTGTITRTLSTNNPVTGTKCQKIDCTNLGTASTDRAAVQLPQMFIDKYVGQTIDVIASAERDGTSGCLAGIVAEFYDSAGVLSSTSFNQFTPGTGAKASGSPVIVVPTGAYSVLFYICAHSRSGAPGAAWIEFDAVSFTIRGTNVATAVAAHKNHLFFGFGPSVQHSGTGLPYQWTVISGAAEIHAGDAVTELVVVPSGDSAALMIGCDNSVHVLYGDSAATPWQLRTVSRGGGMAKYSAQEINGGVIAMDQGRFVYYRPSQNFGNFAWSSVSEKIEPLLRASVATYCSVMIPGKNKYRVFPTVLEGAVADYGITGVMTKPGVFEWTKSNLFKFPAVGIVCAAYDEGMGRPTVWYGTDDGHVLLADTGMIFSGGLFTAADPKVLSFIRVATRNNGGMERGFKRISFEFYAEKVNQHGSTAHYDCTVGGTIDDAQNTQRALNNEVVRNEVATGLHVARLPFRGHGDRATPTLFNYSSPTDSGFCQGTFKSLSIFHTVRRLAR